MELSVWMLPINDLGLIVRQSPVRQDALSESVQMDVESGYVKEHSSCYVELSTT